MALPQAQLESAETVLHRGFQDHTAVEGISNILGGTPKWPRQKMIPFRRIWFAGVQDFFFYKRVVFKLSHFPPLTRPVSV